MRRLIHHIARPIGRRMIATGPQHQPRDNTSMNALCMYGIIGLLHVPYCGHQAFDYVEPSDVADTTLAIALTAYFSAHWPIWDVVNWAMAG